MSFTIAETVQQAIEAMAGGARPIAGGSDLVVSARQSGSALPGSLVAIDRVAELKSITATPHELTIGACVTHADLMIDSSVLASATAVADAAALVGSPATRNVGTIGGNVMNASPAMDTGAPLFVHDASVALHSTRGGRSVPINELWTGPGQTVAGPDELCVAVSIPVADDRSGSAYVRLEYRRAMEIAVVGAAAWVRLDGTGAVVDARVAMTAVAPTIVAVTGMTETLVGKPVDEAALAEVSALATGASSPISDLRAGQDYRRHMVGVMAKRAVAVAAGRAAGHAVPVPANHSFAIGAAL